MKEGNQSHEEVFDTTLYLCPVFQQKVTGSEIKQKKVNNHYQEKGTREGRGTVQKTISSRKTFKLQGSPWFLALPV